MEQPWNSEHRKRESRHEDYPGVGAQSTLSSHFAVGDVRLLPYIAPFVIIKPSQTRKHFLACTRMGFLRAHQSRQRASDNSRFAMEACFHRENNEVSVYHTHLTHRLSTSTLFRQSTPWSQLMYFKTSLANSGRAASPMYWGLI